MSKCIPIYYGAPDIELHVPANTFIDMRNFKTFEELDFFLENISKKEMDAYLDNIEKYLKSEEFLKFTDLHFAHQVFDIVHKHFELNSKKVEYC